MKILENWYSQDNCVFILEFGNEKRRITEQLNRHFIATKIKSIARIAASVDYNAPQGYEIFQQHYVPPVPFF